MESRQRNAPANMKSDYVGGRWINDEYYFESKVEKDVQTKEDAIYGVFSQGFTQGQGGGGRARGRNRDFGGGVSFVSSGKILGGDKKTPEESEPSVIPARDSGSIGQEPEKGPDVASKFAARTEQKKKQFKRKRVDQDFGAWGKHGNNFGAKMLAKWGVKKGMGLGKSGQGRVNPITVDTQRGMSDGLGFGKRPGAAKRVEEEEVEDSEDKLQARREKRAKLKQEYESNWRKSLKPTKKIYQDAQTLLSGSQNNASKPQVVIDMRGPNVRMTSLDKMNELEEDEEEDASSNIPELQHNLRLVVELTESEIIKLSREKEHHEDTMYPLANQRDKLEGSIEIQRQTITQLEQVQGHIAACEAKLEQLTKQRSPINLRLQTVEDLIGLLQNKYSALYRDFELVNLAIAMGFPLVELLLFNWEPLHDSPTQTTQGVLNVLASWKLMLSEEHIQGHQEDVWTQLVQQLLMTKLHRCIREQWRTRQYGPMIGLLNTLKPLLPEMYSTFISQMIVPKMTHALDTWNPRTDMTPVHTWIHPWIGTIPEDLMEVLYQRIRHKLSIVLQHWQPHDSSALTVIKPWQTAFRASDFEEFLGRNILQKLQLCLRTKFTVNPLDQYKDPFQWVMCWADTFPTRMMVHLLERDFFPKWFQALFDWLSRQPDFDEVSGWYMGWKNMLTPALQKHPRMTQMFNSALDLMNEAVSGDNLNAVYNRIVQDLNRPTVSLAMPRVLQRPVQQQQQQASRPKQRHVELSFKETLERLAGMHSITYLPAVGRTVDGSQVYEFNRLSIYLERENIFVLESQQKGSHRGSRWRPISLPDLLALAKM